YTGQRVACTDWLPVERGRRYVVSQCTGGPGWVQTGVLHQVITNDSNTQITAPTAPLTGEITTPPSPTLITPVSNGVIVDIGPDDHRHKILFGNVCLGGGGAHSVAYWGTTGLSQVTSADLTFLKTLNLRTNGGANFDPQNPQQLRTWLTQASPNGNIVFILA